nr:MAG TPA: hypothetical protein [Caudoviricetes sp.]
MLKSYRYRFTKSRLGLEISIPLFFFFILKSHVEAYIGLMN